MVNIFAKMNQTFKDMDTIILKQSCFIGWSQYAKTLYATPAWKVPVLDTARSWREGIEASGVRNFVQSKWCMMHEILDRETFAPASSSYPSSLVWAAGARDSRSSTMDSYSVRNIGVAIAKLLAARKTASNVVDFGIGRASLHAFGSLQLQPQATISCMFPLLPWKLSSVIFKLRVTVDVHSQTNML